MENNMIPLTLSDTFTFSCSERIPCFTECCQDLNQCLTPYDILRLKNHFNLTSTVFLEQYTKQHVGPDSGLPIITLKPDPARGLKCPFVTESGCSVYSNRPSSCRIYPLARLASQSRKTGEITEQYMLLREPHCLGFNQAKVWTVQSWVSDQGIAAYNQMNDLLMEIISLKNRLIPGPLDITASRMFHMACYDLDTFRSNILQKDNLDDWNVDVAALAAVENDDEALLKLSLNWIKYKLFENGT